LNSIPYRALSLLLPVLSALAFPAFLAADFGVILNEQFDAELRDGEELSSKTVLAPWFSLPLGDRAELYLSAGGSVYYREEGTDLFPELFHLEISLMPASSLTLRAGRIDYQDPSLFTAKGRFDGLDLSWDPGPLRLSLGAYYTGFLYRNTANISVSPGDPADYGTVLDYGDFAATYFAPRRALGALQIEYPGFIVNRGTFHAGLLSQYDLSDAGEKLHTQYLLLRYALSLPGGLDLGAAGAASLRVPGGGKAAFASSLEAGILLPGGLQDRISLGVRWASGEGPSTAAYFPVVKEAQGRVIKSGFSGLMIVSAEYEARFLSSLSAELGGRYFLRTDSASFTDPYLEGDSRLLGLEVSLSVLWAPFSDLSFSFGGGIFLPGTGEALREAPLYGQLTAVAIVSF
jgi:hypothetical protein